MFRSVALRYDGWLTSRPIITKATTTLVICSLGDMFTQVVFRKKDRPFALDWRRTMNFGILGFTIVGPPAHFWYGFLSKAFPGRSFSTGLRRMLADQFLFAPVGLGSFIVSLAILENKTSTIRTQKTYERWKETVKINWVLWIPAQLFNFSVVPLRYQVLFANGTAFIWNAILSYKAYEDRIAEEAQ